MKQFDKTLRYDKEPLKETTQPLLRHKAINVGFEEHLNNLLAEQVQAELMAVLSHNIKPVETNLHKNIEIGPIDIDILFDMGVLYKIRQQRSLELTEFGIYAVEQIQLDPSALSLGGLVIVRNQKPSTT